MNKYSVICMPAGHGDNAVSRDQYWIERQPVELGFGCSLAASNQTFTQAKNYVIDLYKDAKAEIDREIKAVKNQKVTDIK